MTMSYASYINTILNTTVKWDSGKGPRKSVPI